uniref:Uncharacterized protein n=1 Tax=Aegilops tauschii subsp. strangulata TaxID=200361 RepID=A0A452Z660_AEGTS
KVHIRWASCPFEYSSRNRKSNKTATNYRSLLRAPYRAHNTAAAPTCPPHLHFAPGHAGHPNSKPHTSVTAAADRTRPPYPPPEPATASPSPCRGLPAVRFIPSLRVNSRHRHRHHARGDLSSPGRCRRGVVWSPHGSTPARRADLAGQGMGDLAAGGRW